MWEGVGVCSYLLVSFWFTRIAANQNEKPNVRLKWLNLTNPLLMNSSGCFINNNLKRFFSTHLNKFKSSRELSDGFDSNLYITSLIVGSLLSSSYLEKREQSLSSKTFGVETETIRIIFIKYSDNVEYLMWFHSVFARAGYCNAEKPKLYRFIGKGNKVLFIYKFKTYSFSCFTWLFDLFYPVQYSQVKRCDSRAEMVKYIPENLYEYITPMSLATLFLSSVWEGKAIFSPKVMLDASYYDLNEKAFNNLALILKNKYNIETVAKVNRSGLSLGSLTIKNSSVFASVIKPYILPSQVHLLSRPNLKLNLLGNLQFKKFLTMSSIRSLSTNLYVKDKNVAVLENPSTLNTISRPLLTIAKNLDGDFIEWFRGFTDAEGSFGIKKESNSSLSFSFQIGLHKDDANVLIFVQNSLGIGKISYYSNSVRWVVKNQYEILVILDIFTQHPLNTSKYLNYLAFKEAFEIYTSRGSWAVPSDLVEKVLVLKNSMNTYRTNFEMGSHNIRVTPNWFLGFVEGEGSFNVVQDDLGLRFSITQSSIDLAVLEAIKEFLIKLCARLDCSFNSNDCTFVGIDFAKSYKIKQRDWCILRTSSNWFIGSILIPFFDSLGGTPPSIVRRKRII